MFSRQRTKWIESIPKATSDRVEPLGTRLPGVPLRNENFPLLPFPIHRSIPDCTFSHVSRNLRVELPTEAYDQPTSAYGGHAARRTRVPAARATRPRASTCAYAFPSGPLRAFRNSDGRTEAQLYGQECLIDVTTFEVGGSSVRHFFMSFISAPSLLLFESRFDCWLLVTPLPFPGYIFSRWFKDSLRNFCNRNRKSFREAVFFKNKNLIFRRI